MRLAACVFLKYFVGMFSSLFELSVSSGIASDNLHVEDKVRVGGDSGLGSGAVGGASRATEISLLADAHLGKSRLPALDHGHLTNGESDGLSAGNG